MNGIPGTPRMKMIDQYVIPRLEFILSEVEGPG
jgi:hypothetical protein